MTILSRLLIPALTAVILTLIAALSLARGAEQAPGGITVTSAWARATPPGASVGAAYLTVANSGTADDRLVGAASPVARSVSLHESTEADGVMRMRPLAAAPVPAGGSLAMSPGGIHIMLDGLTAPLEAGEEIPITLTFGSGANVTASVHVQPIGADGPDDGGGMSGMDGHKM